MDEVCTWSVLNRVCLHEQKDNVNAALCETSESPEHCCRVNDRCSPNESLIIDPSEAGRVAEVSADRDSFAFGRVCVGYVTIKRLVLK